MPHARTLSAFGHSDPTLWYHARASTLALEVEALRDRVRDLDPPRPRLLSMCDDILDLLAWQGVLVRPPYQGFDHDAHLIRTLVPHAAAFAEAVVPGCATRQLTVLRRIDAVVAERDRPTGSAAQVARLVSLAREAREMPRGDATLPYSLPARLAAMHTASAWACWDYTVKGDELRSFLNEYAFESDRPARLLACKVTTAYHNLIAHHAQLLDHPDGLSAVYRRTLGVWWLAYLAMLAAEADRLSNINVVDDPPAQLVRLIQRFSYDLCTRMISWRNLSSSSPKTLSTKRGTRLFVWCGRSFSTARSRWKT